MISKTLTTIDSSGREKRDPPAARVALRSQAGGNGSSGSRTELPRALRTARLGPAGDCPAPRGPWGGRHGQEVRCGEAGGAGNERATSCREELGRDRGAGARGRGPPARGGAVRRGGERRAGEGAARQRRRGRAEGASRPVVRGGARGRRRGPARWRRRCAGAPRLAPPWAPAPGRVGSGAPARGRRRAEGAVTPGAALPTRPAPVPAPGRAAQGAFPAAAAGVVEVGGGRDERGFSPLPRPAGPLMAAAPASQAAGFGLGWLFFVCFSFCYYFSPPSRSRSSQGEWPAVGVAGLSGSARGKCWRWGCWPASRCSASSPTATCPGTASDAAPERRRQRWEKSRGSAPPARSRTSSSSWLTIRASEM